MAVILLGWIADFLTLDVLLYELAHHRFHLRKAITANLTETIGPS